MRVMVVGASQAGLHLAHGLLDKGHAVDLMSGHPSGEIRTGTPPLVGFSLPEVAALEAQRARHAPRGSTDPIRGLDRWSSVAPAISGVRMRFRASPEQEVDFTGRMDLTVIDRRVKTADWMEMIEDRGGKVMVQGVTTLDLSFFVNMYDLVVVAVGTGELGAFFHRDRQRSPAGRARALTQIILDEEPKDVVSVVTSPAGEVFDTPILTSEGIARAVWVAAPPEGSLDCRLPGRPSAAQVLARMRERLAADPHTRDLADTLIHSAPLERAVRMREVEPVVRRPVASVAGSGVVVGIGETVMTSDPITGQETLAETLAAEAYLAALGDHDGPVDEAMAHAMFDRYYDAHGANAARLTQMVSGWWDAAPPAHVMTVLDAATRNHAVADYYVSGFNNPDAFTRLLDPEQGPVLLRELGYHT